MADARRQVSTSSSATTTSRSSAATAALNAERDAVDLLHSLSTLLQTGLTRSDLKASMTLLGQGVHPTALAQVITDLRAEGARTTSTSTSTSTSTAGRPTPASATAAAGGEGA
ncbi:hypothetical protein BCV69DRAFT_285358 [Microstroma glucosiphilum]|uniref:Mitotic-spindle organizing protein 1 n=1 Tax=Pseudomicrostroma glucosiphilum TaxID=1684307 RepID=A0A316U0K4_9BASI|nr:hypothetical protein BCV69DRAFT_285358 [Pseudomicrostroma glucosiphilum]PWN18061.1 hypothetical protein BCV69DRAFT_285358 [Pseudomicrostroma glucosiphilum]